MSRVHKKTRLYIRDAEKYLSEYEQPVPDEHSFVGWLYRGYIICRGKEICPHSNFDTDLWFRSSEPFYGELINDVEFEIQNGGWETINCIMDNVDDAIDEIPMDKHDGVHWMVGFRTGGETGAVRMIVPHWNVQEAREWVMKMTGHYVGSMTRVFMGEQPRVIAREGKYEY